MKAAISWSAGKDACLAWLRAQEAGLDVRTFVTMQDADGSSKSHALSPDLVAAQVAALGGQSLGVPVAARPGAYGEAFAAVLSDLVARQHTHMVFGDIDLQAHRDWLEPLCQRAGLQAVFPLWHQPRAALAQEIVRRGIQARLVCVDTQRLDASFCGAAYDAALLQALPAGVCPCGEDGEFHTVVWNAPGFAQPLALRSLGQRRIVSTPPLRPTTLVFEQLVLA